MRTIAMTMLWCLISSLGGLSARRAAADCGSVPFWLPLTGPLELVLDSTANSPTEVAFDPLKISIFEPRQRAIICWNGIEQILLLSTDQRATQATAVLEIIPLPSEPEVSLGDFKTFEAAQALIVEKRMWAFAHGGARAGAVRVPAKAARISFAQKMGAHDLAVAEVLAPEGFVAFVQKFLREKYNTPAAPIREDFVSIIESYLDDGFKWFAFDVIALTDKNQSREPIQYRFKSEEVFYPMRISTLERGKTEVDLLVFTPEGVSPAGYESRKTMKREPRVSITDGEFGKVNEKWRGFFGEASTLTIDQWKVTGDISTFTIDIRAR